MKKLKTQLIDMMKHEDSWVHGGQLERMEFKHPNGGFYKPSTVSRQMRILVEEERVERETNEKGHVMYKYKKSPYEKLHEQMRMV
jgi:capsular polysaccharide biosynthesis protein